MSNDVETDDTAITTEIETNSVDVRADAPKRQPGWRQDLWTAVAPPVAWWWLVIAGAAALFLGFGLLRAVQLFARPLGVLILSVAIAASFVPLVTRLRHYVPRTLAIILIYLTLLLIIVGLGWLVAPSFIEQLQAFIANAPDLFERAQDIYGRWTADGGDSIVPMVTSLIDGVGLDVLSFPFALGESVLQVFLILFTSFYALLVSDKVRDFILSLIPAQHHQGSKRTVSDMMEAMGGYVRGTALSAAIVGLFTYVGLYFLGVEYPLVLAILASILEIVPILGTLISTIVIVLVAFFQSPQLALFTLIYMLILQQLQGNVLFPAVMSSQTNISPLLSIFAFFAGGVVGGLLGAVVAIPLAAALSVLTVDIVAPAIRRWSGATPKPISSEDDADEDDV